MLIKLASEVQHTLAMGLWQRALLRSNQRGEVNLHGNVDATLHLAVERHHHISISRCIKPIRIGLDEAGRVALDLAKYSSQ